MSATRVKRTLSAGLLEGSIEGSIEVPNTYKSKLRSTSEKFERDGYYAATTVQRASLQAWWNKRCQPRRGLNSPYGRCSTPFQGWRVAGGYSNSSYPGWC